MGAPDETPEPDAARAEMAAIVDELETRAAERRLHAFVRLLWPQADPAPFTDNWHIGAMCDHLQAVAAGEFKNLVINVPPGTTKSLTTSVMFPAWVWTRSRAQKFLCMSYEQRLANRNAETMRTLVTSEAYQRRWPVQLSDTQNAKVKYSTQEGGWRISLGMGGAVVGEHPNGKIVDDPHNTMNAVLTEREIEQAVAVWDHALPLRGAGLGAWTVLVMQRLHERDLTGHWLSRAAGSVVKLVLPMRYEPPAWVMVGGAPTLVPRMPVTPLGFQDPRTEAGELLWPAMWPAEKFQPIIDEQLGSWGESGQLQQRPAPASGLMFKAAWFKLVEALPAAEDVVAWVRYWDVAGTEGGRGARTAGVKIGRLRDGRFIIADVVKGRWSEKDVDDQVHATAVKDGRGVPVREEQEPGSSGKAVVAARTRRMAGFDYRGAPPAGDKVTRARPLCAQAEAGNVLVYAGPEADLALRERARELVDEFAAFPLGATKDQVDASAGAFNTLTAEDAGELELLFGAGTGTAPATAALDAELAALEARLGGARPA